MVHLLLLCHLCCRFCHPFVVVVVAIIVVVFVIVFVVVAMAAVARAGARARGKQRQQQQQCRALGVRTIPPGTIKMILRAEEEERLLAGCRGGMRSGGRCPGQLRLPEVRVEAGGSSLSRCFCLRGGWGRRWQAGRRWRHGDGPPAPRMLELGQEAEFYMVNNVPPSTRGGVWGRRRRPSGGAHCEAAAPGIGCLRVRRGRGRNKCG